MTTPKLRYKPDGRPYADCRAFGLGRISILAKGATPPWPSGERAELLFAAWLEHKWPALLGRDAKSKARKIVTIADLVRYYVEVRLADRAESTRVNAGFALGDMAKALAGYGVRTIRDLRANYGVLDELKADMLKEHKPGTVATRLAYLRAAVNAAAETGRIPDDTVKRWPKVKGTKPKYKDMPSDAAIAAFFERMRRSIHYRAVLLMWMTGLRPSDVVRIEKQHVNEDRLVVRQQKTGDYVVIHLSPAARSILMEAIVASRSSRYVFADRRGRPFTAQALIATCGNRGKGLGITAKTARQWAVTALTDNNYAPQSIGELSGHRSREYETYQMRRAGARQDMAQTVADSLGAILDCHPNVTPFRKSLRGND